MENIDIIKQKIRLQTQKRAQNKDSKSNKEKNWAMKNLLWLVVSTARVWG